MIQDGYGAKSLYALEYRKILSLLMERADGFSGSQNGYDIEYATAPGIENRSRDYVTK